MIRTMRSPSGSGRLVLERRPNMWKVTAPNQMPNAIASPPMTVSPGYFTSIRRPSFRSSDTLPSQAVPRPSRSVSLCSWTPPKATKARRLASTGSSRSSRMSRWVSISIWKRISSSILDSVALRERRRRRARAAWNQLMECSPNQSRNPQHGLEARREPPPVLKLGAEGSASGDRQPIVPGTTVVVGRVPIAGHETVLLEPLQGGVERPLVHLQHAFGDLLHPLADPPAVHGLEGERLQDQQVERAPEG